MLKLCSRPGTAAAMGGLEGLWVVSPSVQTNVVSVLSPVVPEKPQGPLILAQDFKDRWNNFTVG